MIITHYTMACVDYSVVDVLLMEFRAIIIDR